MEKSIYHEINIKNVRIKDSFWSEIQELIINTVIPYQEKVLNDEIPGVEKSHAIDNFRIAAGEKQGEFFGMVFQDSDVAKWLEASAYSLAVQPDKELEERMDAIIDIIEKAQQPDGYLNTYFTIKEPGHRWQNLQECHELYCTGHMMEAAAAYYEVTGKDKLLHIMERMADHIAKRFGHDKKHGIPGHQEIEYGLLRMYSATGKEEYLKLARYFIDERGQNPEYFAEEREKRGWFHFNMNPVDTKYSQCFAPVRQQTTAEGHSVRAVYMYAAMARLAGLYKDSGLLNACRRLWDNITGKRMYITGGIGSTAEYEGFTIDYDLPNDTVYAETCASIGLIFFSKSMLNTVGPSNKYADVMEQAMYNGVISGMQLDGKSFFYVNPLEVNPGISGELPGYKHVKPVRQGWYACACCPPNMARLLAALGKYAWDYTDNMIISHLFIGGEACFQNADIRLETDYPQNGNIKYIITPHTENEFCLAVRIPSWCKSYKVLLNDSDYDDYYVKEGYLYIRRIWQDGDTIRLTLDIPIRRIYSNTKVRSDAGCVALMRGPVVYCFEEADNGQELQALRIPRKAPVKVLPYNKSLLNGIVALQIEGLRLKGRDELYSEQPPKEERAELTAIPYYVWGNRGLNQMRVWMLEA